MPFIENQILLYNPSLGLYDTYAFRDGILTRLQQKPIAPGYTLAAGDGQRVIFYNKGTGHLAAERVNRDGSLTQVDAATIEPGWSHIVPGVQDILYYNDESGQGKFVHRTGGAFYGGLAKYWTVIASRNDLLFFYSAAYGRAAFDTFEDTGGPPPVSIGLSELRGFPDYSFGQLWTNVVFVESGNALLFYRKSDGWSVIGDIDSSWKVGDRPGTAKHLTAGWDAIVPIENKLLFYDGFGGNYTLGHVEADGYHEDESHPGGMLGGFTQVVPCAYVEGP